MLVLGMIVFTCLRGRGKLASVDISAPVSKGHLGQKTGIVVEINPNVNEPKDLLCVRGTFVFTPAT
jgi:hypothetical protein